MRLLALDCQPVLRWHPKHTFRVRCEAARSIEFTTNRYQTVLKRLVIANSSCTHTYRIIQLPHIHSVGCAWPLVYRPFSHVFVFVLRVLRRLRVATACVCELKQLHIAFIFLRL